MTLTMPVRWVQSFFSKYAPFISLCVGVLSNVLDKHEIDFAPKAVALLLVAWTLPAVVARVLPDPCSIGEAGDLVSGGSVFCVGPALAVSALNSPRVTLFFLALIATSIATASLLSGEVTLSKRALSRATYTELGWTHK